MSTLRLSISQKFASAMSIGTHGLPGMRNARGRSGRLRRMIGMPSATSVNADNVPILTISARISTFRRQATNATTTPTMICRRAGVPCLPTFDRLRGSRPSRLMAKITRVNPSSSTITTVVKPMTIPREMIFAAHVAPASSKPVAKDGLSTFASCLYDTMPVVTMATSMYRTVTIVIPKPIPSGTLRPGSFVSSEAVATTSKPRNAKNTSAAPDRIPGTP